jgi:uncharacterized membrane protein YphA (DoxX/SURF4 family)
MNISQAAYNKVMQSWWLLKVTYGLLFIIAGADKFMNLVTDWPKYVSQLVLNMFSVNAQQFIWGVGIIEIIIGLAILLFATRVGAYLAMSWLLIIVFNLLATHGFYDIAVRDTVMAMGALVLAMLTEAQEELRSI